MNEEELLEVVSRRVQKYTSNDSTSITYQTASQIMESVLYCMEDEKFQHTVIKELCDQYELQNPKSNRSANEVFQIGLNRKKEKIQSANKLYETICVSFKDYKNECYYDTIVEGMKCFFERYNVEFDAINHILTLDYPLLYGIVNLKGIDLIYEYLLRTYIEQKFLEGFEEKDILDLLYAYHNKYEELIINIARIVLRNALACIIANKSLDTLMISNEERDKVKKVCECKSVEELETILMNALDMLIKEKEYEVSSMHKYLENDIHDIACEIKNSIDNNCLEKLFISVKPKEMKQKSIYVDGKNMEDEELRKLIDRMSSLSIEKRIELIKENVKSLMDLKEVLKACFYQEEFYHVFELLSIDERCILLKDIKEKEEFDEELEEWEKNLVQFLTS